MSPLYTVFRTHDIDNLYLEFYFKTTKWHRFMKLNGDSGARFDRFTISSTQFMEMPIPYPTLEEQQKIGEYFESLDTLITLHHRKYINGKKEELLAWEQRKLGDDLVSIHTGTNLLGSTTNIGMPLIKMGNIQRGYFDTSKVEFLAENEQPDNEDIANYGDFFFNTRNTLELVGKGATWMKNSGEYAFNSNIARFELRNIDTIFFNYLYNTETMTRQIHARAMGTTSVAAIYPRTLESVGYLVPCMKEQQKIGAYFKHLDHLITLHQRKCEETKKLKKFMLQKMFPKKGEKVPEIRFGGFTDDWEQRKFGEIVEKYEDPVETPTEGYTRLGIRSHAKGTFHSYVEKGKELETAKMFRVAADKFIVNITFGWEHAVAITDENDAGKLVSHRFPQYSFNAGMEPKFFRYLILDENFKHHLELSSPGGAGRNRVLKLSDMLQYKMNFPSEAEQKKIAAYFDDLDHLITLHQHKCEELQNIKKFMLQNMFI